MKDSNFDLLKAALETRLAAISTGSDRRSEIVIQQSPDSLDQTQFTAERDLTVSLLNHESDMYRRVKGALQRLDDGAYGVCLACEEPISAKRLQAVPWAELCLDCQWRADQAAAGVLGAELNERAGLN
jgi:DnaK suppressor protein